MRAAKNEVLELLRLLPRGRRAPPPLRPVACEEPQELRDYALYEALREELGSGGWQSWPGQYHDPSSSAVSAFARKKKERVEFYAYVQWNARLQLDLVQRRALELGMPVGLYFDLALGADRGGAEVWSDREAYATGASIGAPPDEFNPAARTGACRRTRRERCVPRATGRSSSCCAPTCRSSGALRLDHVMALSRLYWIPAGAKPDTGGYVHYPLEELLGLLAQESRRNRCMVIGEDLGTVTPALRTALNEAGVLSYRPLLFEKDAAGEFRPPAAYPREALTCLSTHDLPTWRGFWEGTISRCRRNSGWRSTPRRNAA